MKLNSSLQVQRRGNLIIVRDPAALDEMAKPHVMGAIWRGAWSEGALQAARDFAETEWPSCRPNGSLTLSSLRGSVRLKSLQFQEDRHRVAGVFGRLVSTLTVRSESEPYDLSKLEDLGKTRPIAWHQDGGQMTLVSAVTGLTTLILDHRPAGNLVGRSGASTNFEPADPAAVRKLALRPSNADAFIFKGRDFDAAARSGSPIHSWPAKASRRVLVQHFIG
jgi:hypothetical protein